MSDRKTVLENAARKAGYYLEWVAGEPYVAEAIWNPYDDDAHAFRLMADVGFDTCKDYIRGALEANAIEPAGDVRTCIRHAIVLAASEEYLLGCGGR
jgi:hypothetical protein